MQINTEENVQAKQHYAGVRQIKLANWHFNPSYPQTKLQIENELQDVTLSLHIHCLPSDKAYGEVAKQDIAAFYATKKD